MDRITFAWIGRASAAMTEPAKGTAEPPGRNVRQKAGLNRAVLDKGWGGFLRAVGRSVKRQPPAGLAA